MQHTEYLAMRRLESTHFWFVGKRASVRTLLNSLKFRNKTFLDIGSGTGGMTTFLTEWGSVTGVENNETALQLNIHKPLVKADAKKLPFKDESFDCVTIFDVLYHKNIDEAAVLAEAARVLKKDGYLIVTDCAHPALYSAHDEIMHARKRFTKKELEEIISKNNFQILRSSYLFFSTFPAFMLQRILSKKSKINKAVQSVPGWLNSLLVFVISVEAKLLRYVNLPMGSSILVIARKK